MGDQIKEFNERTQDNFDKLHKCNETHDGPVAVPTPNDVLVQDKKQQPGQSLKRTVAQTVECMARGAIQTIRSLHRQKRRQR